LFHYGFSHIRFKCGSEQLAQMKRAKFALILGDAVTDYCGYGRRGKSDLTEDLD
jgi:hypothetical protein